MNASKPLVCWLEQCSNDMVGLVGGKCASLGELINAGIRVPPGFAVTTAGYYHFMEASGVQQDIDRLLADLDHDDLPALERASAQIRAQIEAARFPLELEDQIAEYYRRLSVRSFMPATAVAVRSSATAEDLPGASFAGQQDTYLWIRGVDEVLEHAKRCMSSLYTARAIAYRLRMGFDHRDIGLSVGVQKMANSYTAGVMFTLNPSNGDRSSIVIDSNFGFGESVVSGEVTPDQFRINKVSLEILGRTISEKTLCYTVDPKTQSSKRVEVPEERRTIQSVVDGELLELARMGKLIEQHYGRPMDIEWAIDKDMPEGGNIFILQARPETVWSERKNEPVSAKAKGGSALDFILASMMEGKKVN
ncbi:MAG TPA: PEP/pyruvate-binding domain-containing protein [Gammaproteobacteria bacterium]